MNYFDKFVSGDEKAFEELVYEYSGPLLRYCYSILGNYSDAEDATQIVFIKVHNKRGSIQNELAIRSYLYKISYRTCIDIIRKRKLFLLPSIKENDMGSYYDNYDIKFPAEIANALRKLHAFDRALIYQRIVNEVSYKELASIYGKTEGQLRKRYERARKKLSVQLRDDTVVPKVDVELGGLK